MDIPFYRNPKEIYRTIKTTDNLEPPKINSKNSTNINSEYVSDIVFTTGLIFFFSFGD